MRNLLLLTLLLTTSVFAQKTFDIKDASKYFNVRIDATECDEYACEGPAVFSFYKKSGGKPYQIIKMDQSYVPIEPGDKTLVNSAMLYEEQGAINVGDYNFDGMEDVALRNGNNGSYGGPSYSVYLSNRAKGQFVYHQALSELAEHLGMFTVDKKARTIEVLDKSGCCWHSTERYKVIGNKPVKVYEMEENMAAYDEKSGESITVITTKKLVNGKWRTTVKKERVKN